MMRLYKYLYYRLYTWNLKTWGENDLPQWNALFGVSFMMFLNLGLFAFFFHFMGFNIFLRNELPKKELVIIMLSLFILNYFLFIHKGKYKAIKKEFIKDSPQKRKMNTVLLWLYVVFSFALFIFCAMLIRKLDG